MKCNSITASGRCFIAFPIKLNVAHTLPPVACTLLIQSVQSPSISSAQVASIFPSLGMAASSFMNENFRFFCENNLYPLPILLHAQFSHIEQSSH